MAKDPTRTKRTYPFQMFAVPRERVVRIHPSSGPLENQRAYGYTQADDTWAHLVARSIHASGGRTGDIVLVSYARVQSFLEPIEPLYGDLKTRGPVRGAALKRLHLPLLARCGIGPAP